MHVPAMRHRGVRHLVTYCGDVSMQSASFCPQVKMLSRFQGQQICIHLRGRVTFQSPALALLRDLERDLDLGERDREAAGLSRLTLLSLVRLTGQITGLVSMR